MKTIIFILSIFLVQGLRAECGIILDMGTFTLDAPGGSYTLESDQFYTPVEIKQSDEWTTSLDSTCENQHILIHEIKGEQALALYKSLLLKYSEQKPDSEDLYISIQGHHIVNNKAAFCKHIPLTSPADVTCHFFTINESIVTSRMVNSQHSMGAGNADRFINALE